MPPALDPIPQRRSSKRRPYSPDALMYVTAAFLWESVWRFQDLWPIIGKLQIPIVLEAALAITLAMSLRGQRSLKWVNSRIFVIPFLLLAIMIAGVPTSLWMGKSVTFITKDFAPSLLLMVAVAVSLRESEDLNWLAFVYLIGATIYSVWTYMFVHVGSDGRLGGAAYYDANDLALLIVCSIPFAIYFLRPTVIWWKRLFALFSLILFVEIVIKSGSRGGFIAFITLMVYIVFAFRSIPTRLRISAIGIAILMMTFFSSAAYWTLMRTILHPKEDYNMTAQTGRKFIWKRGMGYMLTHPVLGVGADAFEQAEGTISAIAKEKAAQNRGFKWSTAHNTFVLVGAELGAGGLILFVTMIATSFNHLLRLRDGPRGDPLVTAEDTAFAQTLVASLIGLCVAGFFVSATYFSFLYALIGLVVAVDSLRRRRAARDTSIGVGNSDRLVTAVRVPPRGHPAKIPHEHWVPAG